MNKKSYGSILIIITTYIIVRIVYKLTGFNYSFSEGILNTKLIIDLILWIIIYVPVKNIFDKVLLQSKEKV
ncbi:hypothetical protein KQI42_10430 [Tissierella sp. MSJ-40]|uniref:Uncharacterized protein n=1 Tax=Tissierella simiarum TaxID=2841534 RepID=A0ABS6E680_9FIRM|nr:hypothetical protein [Tissierella simiarum]MBU5438427.1 hypothetical protein [Tissierella simiarum]